MLDCPRVSLIITARNEEEYIDQCIEQLFSSTSCKNFEIIALNDGSTDNTESKILKLKYPALKYLKSHGIGTARARNFAARHATGDIIIFSDAHIFVPEYWLEKIIDTYSEYKFQILAVSIFPDTRGKGHKNDISYGQSLDQELNVRWIMQKPAERFAEVPVAAGGFVIYHKDVFRALNAYEENFNTWGYEDVEISLKAWLFGYKTVLMPDFAVSHVFRDKTPFRVDMTDFMYNKFSTALLHFNDSRVDKLKKIIYKRLEKGGHDPDKSIEKIILQAQSSNILKKSLLYHKVRKYTDDWFFNKFGINF